MGRKHSMVYEVEGSILISDLPRLREALGKRKVDNFVVTLADDEDDESTADFVEVFIAYGPVHGANRTDVTRWFERNKITYGLDDTTGVSTYACGCASSSPPCADEAPAASPPTAAVRPEPSSEAEWKSGDDW